MSTLDRVAMVRAALAHELAELRRRTSLLEHLNAAVDECQTEAELKVVFDWLAPAEPRATRRSAGHRRERHARPCPPAPALRTRARRGSMSQKIEAAIARSSAGLSATEIARRVSRDVSDIYKTLQQLVRQNRIHQRGRFYLPGPAPMPAAVAALMAEAAPAPEPASPLRPVVRDGDIEFDVVPIPRASSALGSSLKTSTLKR